MARKGFGGFTLTTPINRIVGKVALALNVRGYWEAAATLRARLTDAILTVSAAIQTVCRLNDSTPAGPVGGFTYIVKDSGGGLYSGTTGTLTAKATGLSTNPVSVVTFRPNTSVQPWGYVADSAPSPNVNIVADSFHCAGMLKVRSDGKVRKMGIAEPQAAPTVTFPGGGTGPSQIYYKYVYRASETGAVSNPSPVSTPGTNSQSNPSATVTANDHATKLTFNATQYEYLAIGVDGQIRTKGGVTPGTVTDFVIAKNFGFAIPTNVSIDGIQVDLYWQGQVAGTGVLSSVALYYLGGQYGTPKFPGIQNQSFATDTLQGGNADTWGASLTPAIINDPSFGFGVQLTTQLAGGTDRSFMYHWTMTVYYSTQNASITPAVSSDPQVDKIDIYRQGGGLANFTYVGTNPNTATAYTDTLSDLAVAANPELQYDNFEPFPSIDLPRSGVLNASSQVLTWVSGDHFDIRWLPGTIILIGSTTQVAYTAVRRPTSTTSWSFVNNDPNATPIPDGTNLVWNIAEPALAQQPLPYLFGPTDNINFIFGVGDPLRPGTLYWCKGSNLDSAPDTNQMDVTDPSEPLVNGAMSGGRGVLASIKRFWVIMPNFFNAEATATGTSGSTWTLQATSITRGLFIPRCLAVSGGGNIFFRVDDGIHISPGGMGSESITDADLYNLFSHEGSTPTAITRNGITIYPPDDSQPQAQQFAYNNGYLYYTYKGTDNNYHALVFDEAAGGWIYDTYTLGITPQTAAITPVMSGNWDTPANALSPTLYTDFLITTAPIPAGLAYPVPPTADEFVAWSVPPVSTATAHITRMGPLAGPNNQGALTISGFTMPTLPPAATITHVYVVAHETYTSPSTAPVLNINTPPMGENSFPISPIDAVYWKEITAADVPTLVKYQLLFASASTGPGYLNDPCDASWTIVNIAIAVYYTMSTPPPSVDPILIATVSLASLPSDAVITGVKATWDSYNDSGSASSTVDMQIGGVDGTNYTLSWPLTVGPSSHGGLGDFWGWAAYQVRTGFALIWRGPYVGSSYLNNLVITVYYNALVVGAAITFAPDEGESIQGILTGCTDATLRRLSPTGTEVATGTLLTPAIGGQGFMYVQEVTVEYSSNNVITLSTIAADGLNGSYGALDVTLPSTSGAIAKTRFFLSPNKAKLYWFKFVSSDPTFKVYTDGFAVRCKNWGTQEPFKQLNPFTDINPYFPQKGGLGGEN